MGDQRRPFFPLRLPWLSGYSAPRPAAQPPSRPAPAPAAQPQLRSASQTQPAAQPKTTVPIQQPSFRPVGMVSLQKTEPQAPTALRAATEPRATSQPASPTRLTSQIRGASVPPPPSRGATETQISTRPVSPPLQTRAASMPPSASRSQPQLTAQAVSKQQSPSRLVSQPAGQTSGQPSSPSRRVTQVQPTLSPPKKLPMAMQERSQPQPPSYASQGTTFQPFGGAIRPSQATAQVKELAPFTMAATGTSSAPAKTKEREERKKAAEERRKSRTKGPTHEEPEQRPITKHLTAATSAGTSEIGKRHQKKQDEIERKKTWTFSSTDEKQIKTVSSIHPKDWINSSNSQQKLATSNWEQVPLHKEIREDISRFVHKVTTGQPKLSTVEKSISVLTLAGENKGAYFHLGSESAKKDGSVHIHRGYKTNPDDSPDATTDGEVSSRGRRPKDSMTKENPPRAYVNSNTQSINNSLVFESSVNERNPGVHLELIHNLAESMKCREKGEALDKRKAEFNVTPAEKLTYEPTIRRRCLRGLFAELSDSDPDNPEKPRRHGCRYSCGEKNKEKEIGAL